MIIPILLAIEEAVQQAPAVAQSISGLLALAKRVAQGGPDPTIAEINALRDESKVGIAQIQADIDAGEGQ